MSLPVRREMVEKEHPQISIVRQCNLLHLNRSTLYYTPGEESKENMELMDLLDKQYQSTPFYGEKRLLAHLREKGYSINIKRLRRLMKKVCRQTLYPTPQTTRPDKTRYKYPYLLRNLNIDHRNQVWAIDITYIQMERGYMYLFAIIDVYGAYSIYENKKDVLLLGCRTHARRKFEQALKNDPLRAQFALEQIQLLYRFV